MIDPGTGDQYLKRRVTTGCYDVDVSNANDIWKSETVLFFYLPTLAAQVAFMLLSTRILYYILKPLNQPRLVSEILMGILISPELFGSSALSEVLTPLKSILTTETISYVGLIYTVFLAGLDMNFDTILRGRKKATSIAIAGVLIPMLCGGIIYALALKMYKGPPEYWANYDTPKAYMFWTLILSVTGFPMVSHILADLKLLYTGLGRVTLTTAMISDFYNWVMFAMLVPFAINGGSAIYGVLSTIVYVLFCFAVIRPYLVEIIVRKTNQNEWDNSGLFIVVMGAYASAAVTDLLGTHPVVGALVYGIMIPRGKFTHLLIEKSEDFGVVYLAPLFFGSCGIRLRAIYVIKTQGLGLVLFILLLSILPKILSTVIATQFYGMPVLDGVSIGLLMNTKGILPILMLNSAWDKQILSVESFSILTIAVLVMTMMVPLIINAIYKPRKLYKQNKLKTLQNLKAEAELRILACVHNPRQATGMINILEACHTTKLPPLRVFALQLVELTGHTASLFVSHVNQLNQQQSGGEQALTKAQQDLESITNIFQTYAAINENSKVDTIAAASSYSTIHEDIYNLSQEKQANLILLPYHKQSNIEGILETSNTAFQEINRNVMRDAPCTVGIFVDRGLASLFKVNLRVVMVYIGGPDDREALAVAWRLSKHQGVQLSVVRILMFGEAAEIDVMSHVENHGLLSVVVDSEKQKELDDEYVSAFRLKAVSNEDSIKYSEKEVRSRDDIPEVLHEVDEIGYDLYILGQGGGRNCLILTELMKWTDCPELGVIGDIVASNNFGSSSSLLIIQQYGCGGMVFENSNTTQKPNEVVPSNIEEGPVFVKVEWHQ
ncbi:cation/H(+) antiporter 15-like [Vigna umbellata]|uniref:cation/H(+) antiporter 15-like n=1 Tax=Vigna umbellata TaxID=87088 RepID=UPI001F5FD789|nr:cation/H(+) antiporter 15-like [Vigna umbellata]